MRSVAAAGSGNLTIRWADRSTSEATFSLQRCTGSAAACGASASAGAVFASSYSEAVSVASLTRVTSTSTITYTDSALAVGTTYCYKVQACTSASICSAYSNTLCATA